MADHPLHPLLELDDLRVTFASGGPPVRAVRGVSLRIHSGESVGVVGESGSGKSVTFLAALGLSAPNATVEGGVFLDGQDLTRTSRTERRRLLGREMAMVFQNPTSALDPVMSIGAQIKEALAIHHPKMPRAEQDARAVELLDRVGITDPARRMKQYPHEFSGGMCQRAMIAMAIANQPRLLVADEPTTAVDVTIQAQLLELLSEVSKDLNGATVLITHDLGVVAENTDRVVVMYGGRIMEEGATGALLANPQHPYTQGLISCHPSLEGADHLEPIPGSPPNPATLGDGCPFVDRCPVGRDDETCRSVTPPLVDVDGRAVACHYPGTPAFGHGKGGGSTVTASAGTASVSHAAADDRMTLPPTAAPSPSSDSDGATGSLLTAEDLRVEFGNKGFARLTRVTPLVAVDDADLALRAGETLGVVGESGSGKSTLAHALIRLLDPTSGTVRFEGTDITKPGRRQLAGLRDNAQIVFQDPLNSLNPSLTVAANAAEPLRVRGESGAARRAKVEELFQEVGLGEELLDRLPGELSGGQLQRVGIARALSVDPELVVLDEPVSALDVSVQAQILNLLLRLQQARNLAYLFISHDMAVVRYVAHRVAVMYLGKIVEMGPADRVLSQPQHPYTEGMLAAVPEIHPSRDRDEESVLHTEQSRGDLGRGCRFMPRCRYQVEECASTDPDLLPVAPDHAAACLVRAGLTKEHGHAS